MSRPLLSIIILNYNVKDLTLAAVKSIAKNYQKEVSSGQYEVIVTDNASSDGSLKAFKQYRKTTKIKIFRVVDNGGNIGFSGGNNKGIPLAKGKYVLFLNPDTIVFKNTLRQMVKFMEAHPEAGISSCKLINKDGHFDYNCHRGFPTPWNAFCYFSGLRRIFPCSKLFTGYTQGWKDINTTHEVDAVEGAFMLMPYHVGQSVGWWDEDYLFYGEDLQFCWDVKKLGYKVYYVGEVSIMHIGGASSGIKKKTQNITTANIDIKRKVQGWRFDAMKIFYKKNYALAYTWLISWLVIKGIDYLFNKNLPRIKH